MSILQRITALMAIANQDAATAALAQERVKAFSLRAGRIWSERTGPLARCRALRAAREDLAGELAELLVRHGQVLPGDEMSEGG